MPASVSIKYQFCQRRGPPSPADIAFYTSATIHRFDWLNN